MEVLHEAGIETQSVQVEKSTLEDLFRELTSTEGGLY